MKPKLYPPTEVEVHVEKSLYENGYRLYMMNGKNRITNVSFTQEPVEEGTPFNEPTALIPKPVAQAMMQAMWAAGLRPDNGEDSVAHVAALKAHITDLQQIISALLPLKQ